MGFFNLKKKKEIIVIGMLITTSLVFFINFNTINALALPPPPYMDWNHPEPEGRYWGFDTGSIVAWIRDEQSVSKKFIYKISDTYMHHISTDGYCVALQELYYNYSEGKLMEYTDYVAHPIINASWFDHTSHTLMPYCIDGYFPNAINSNPFIPKNSSNVLDIHKSAQFLQNFHNYLFKSWGGYLFSELIVTGNTIKMYNRTFGTYYNMTYYDNGTLEKGYYNFYFAGIHFYGNDTRTFDILPHPPPYMDWNHPEPNGRYWDFDNGSIVGWIQDEQSSSKKLIFNISSTYLKHEVNYGIFNYGDFYLVALKEVYYDSSIQKFKEYTNFTAHPIINSSAVNYTIGTMLPYCMSDPVPCPNALKSNPFIPKNSSDVLDIHKSAQLIQNCFNELIKVMGGYLFSELIISGNIIKMYNSTFGTYYNMTYYDNGILEKGYYNFTLGTVHFKGIETRTFDIIPASSSSGGGGAGGGGGGGGGGVTGGKEKEPVAELIPFGYFYLLFLTIGIISLLAYSKKHKNFIYN